MRVLLRLAALAALALVVAAPAEAALTAPKGLKGFLLRADEPVRHEFSRTPSFAWSPVPGATRYEFQLATSSVFRESGLVYEDEIGGPAISLPITLPWITGNPYSLYARVRAVNGRSTSAWSAPFGFNLRWSSLPRPLPSYPGLIRWTPIEGADSYQVWFVDLGKIVSVQTNVVDEREFYTFHQGPQWVSSVRYRLRAVRGEINKDLRTNGLPASFHGPWSPVYRSTNPPFSVGPLTPVATVSDVVARGRSSDPAHRLMPAFVFSGSQGLSGTSTELYRVYVFTDRDCVNPVFRSAVVGSPAYAPRPYGPLALPRTATGVDAARGTYLADGDEGSSRAADLAEVKPTESDTAAKPTLAVSGKAAAETGAKPSGSTASAAGKAPPAIAVSGDLGAPVDLWDVDWPRGGYYWTVVPVTPFAPASLTTYLAAVAAAGAAQVEVVSAAGLAVGDAVSVGGETATIVSITGTTIALSRALLNAHGPGEAVTRTTGSLDYRDLELAQEACGSGRVLRFGKESEPALTSASSPFASGLSPHGRLTAAAGRTPRFYGTPHVAWTPALGADAYEVQWSRKRYPFRPESDPRTGAAGLMTLVTSASLPLKPGTWHYRVRGVNWSLPTGGQRMSWSTPARIVVARPTYRVLRGGR